MYEYANQGRKPRERKGCVPPRGASALRVRESSATVVTMVEPLLRPQVDAATSHLFATVHAESAHDALDMVRCSSVHTLLLSPSMACRERPRVVRRLASSSPGVAAVAVVGEHGTVTDEGLLVLGACGVRHVVDLTDRDGWNRLRSVVADGGGATATHVIRAVRAALGDVPEGAHRFFEILIRSAPNTRTVRELSQLLGIRATTLASAFFRAELPSPRRYLVEVRLTFAAGFLALPMVSYGDVAYRLGYSSAQGLSRHVRMLLGVTLRELRDAGLAGALEGVVGRLIVPYRERWTSFSPFRSIEER